MKHDADYWKGFWAGRAIAVRLAELTKPIEVDSADLNATKTEGEDET